jgi:hypothetical protein
MIRGTSSHQMPWADSEVHRLACVLGLRERPQLAFTPKEEGSIWE